MDYTNGSRSEREELRQWLAEDEAMLWICAELVNLPLNELKAKLTKRVDRIEAQEVAWSRH